MPMNPCLLVLLAAMLALPASGQTLGEITGVVTDSSGAVIPGATITVTNPQTNFTRAALSNETGNYSFPALQPGVYNVKVELAGFQSEVRNAVELQVQQTARIDFRLNVGIVTDTIQVSAGAPLLNTEDASIGTVIDQKRIEDLPLNGRSFISLIALSPNVNTGQSSSGGFADVRGGSDRGTVSISIAGNRREYTYYTLDGVTNTDVDFNSYAFLPSIDALQEFKVQTGVYSAEFGRGAAQVNVSSRSGTNSFHGAIFEFIRNNALDARPYAFTSQAPVSAPFKWNQYGATVGGPVWIPGVFDGRNRLFFMSNFEGFKLRNQAQQVFSVPSARMRAGDFSEILPTTVVRDPLDNDRPFPGNIVPRERLHPIAVRLLEFLPLPNVTGAGLSNNLFVLQNKTVDKNQFTQRIDLVENGQSTWFGRYSWQEESRLSPYIYLNGTSSANDIKQVMVSNTRIFSPTLVNEFRAGWLGYHNRMSNELANKRDVMKELNLPMLPVPAAAWGLPLITIQGYSTASAGFIGDTQQGPFLTDDHTFQFVNNMSWTRGTHSVKFGFDVRRDRYNVAGNQGMRGTLAFDNQASGYGFGDFMLGYVGTSSQAGQIAIAQLRATSQAYYINDTWKLKPNLTIDAGLRYEFTPPWNSKGDSMINTIVPINVIGLSDVPESLYPHPYLARDCAAYGQNTFYPASSIVRFASNIKTMCETGYDYTTLVRADRTNWAPRLGISWSPGANWTVRLGGGMFYTQDQGNSYLDQARNVAGEVQVNANVATHDLTLDKPFGNNLDSSACGGLPSQLICNSAPGLTSTDPNLRTAYVTQYTLNVQHQLTQSTVVEVGYLGTQGHRLLTRVGYNVAAPAATGSVRSRRPFPEFGNIQSTSPAASSNYHSGTVKLTRRLSSGLSYLTSYTFSKAMDNSSGIFPASGTAPRQPATGSCVTCEYGLSDQDARHRFVTSVLYELPFGRGRRFLNSGVASHIIGGWQLNSIVTKSTGFPLTAVSGTNRSNSSISSGNQRPNAVLGLNSELENPSTRRWFNVEAFALQPFGTFGNLGRNTVTGPGIFSWDFSTLKNFNVGENEYFQFRFECFNCANHPVFGDPNTVLSANRVNANGVPIPDTGAFGTITKTRDGFPMRQLQFSLKFVF